MCEAMLRGLVLVLCWASVRSGNASIALSAGMTSGVDAVVGGGWLSLPFPGDPDASMRVALTGPAGRKVVSEDMYNPAVSVRVMGMKTPLSDADIGAAVGRMSPMPCVCTQLDNDPTTRQCARLGSSDPLAPAFPTQEGWHEIRACISHPTCECDPFLTPMEDPAAHDTPLRSRGVFYAVHDATFKRPGSDEGSILPPDERAAWRRLVLGNPVYQRHPSRLTLASPLDHSIVAVTSDWPLDISVVLNNLPSQSGWLPGLNRPVTHVCVVVDRPVLAAPMALLPGDVYACAPLPADDRRKGPVFTVQIQLAAGFLLDEGIHHAFPCLAAESAGGSGRFECLGGSSPQPDVWYVVHQKHGIVPQQGSDWANAKLNLRVQRVLPPVRFAAQVLTRDEVARAKAEWEAEMATRPPEQPGSRIPDTLPLGKDHWLMDRVRAAVTQVFASAGLGEMRLVPDYAVISGTVYGLGIANHADRESVDVNGMRRKSHGHAVVRSWGLSIALSEEGVEFTPGYFQFVGYPPRVVSGVAPGVGVFYSTGLENEHTVSQVTAGRRLVVLVWFYEEQWSSEADDVFSGLMQFFNGPRHRLPVPEGDKLLEDHQAKLAEVVGKDRSITTPTLDRAVGRVQATQFAMRRPFEPQTVLLTGAGSGIGLALAQQLAETGLYRVIGTVRNLTSADEELSRMQAMGLEVEFIQADLLDMDMDAFVDSVVDALGPGVGLDIVVHNAGIIPRGWSPRVFNDALAVNCIAPVQVSSALLCRGVFAESGARIMHVSSGLGQLRFVSEPYASMIRLAGNLESLQDISWMPADGFYDDMPVTYSLSKACMNRATQLMHAGASPLLDGTSASTKGESCTKPTPTWGGGGGGGPRTFAGITVDSVHPGHVQTKMGGYDAPLSTSEGAAIVFDALLDTTPGGARFYGMNGGGFE